MSLGQAATHRPQPLQRSTSMRTGWNGAGAARPAPAGSAAPANAEVVGRGVGHGDHAERFLLRSRWLGRASSRARSRGVPKDCDSVAERPVRGASPEAAARASARRRIGRMSPLGSLPGAGEQPGPELALRHRPPPPRRSTSRAPVAQVVGAELGANRPWMIPGPSDDDSSPGGTRRDHPAQERSEEVLPAPRGQVVGIRPAARPHPRVVVVVAGRPAMRRDLRAGSGAGSRPPPRRRERRCEGRSPRRRRARRA